MLKDKTIIDVSNTEKSIVDWIQYLQSSGKDKLAATFETDNIRDFQLLRDLHLPTYHSYQVSVRYFLENFCYFQNNFVYDRYCLVLLPVNAKHLKYYLMDIDSLEDAKNFLIERTEGLYDQYMVKISEFEPNIYGGSIISDDDMVIVEIAEGIQSNVARSTTNVISGVLTSSSISMHYNTSDTLKRKLLWKALKEITRNDKEEIDNIELHTIRNLSFLKGYFEFAYVKNPNNNDLRLVFFDLKLNKAYRNLNSYF